MNDMRPALTPKSDQKNADDFQTGPMTITIRDVTIKPGEQPVSIHFEGDEGKPYKPCKSMCRVLVAAWGADASKYVGRSLTLYCDPRVTWGGMAVGGIRISHMSHIESEMMMALTATKGRKAPFTVKPLVKAAASQQPTTTTASPFKIIRPSGAVAPIATADEWRDKMLVAIDALKSDAEKVQRFRELNGPLIADMVVDGFPDQAKAVDAAFTAALA